MDPSKKSYVSIAALDLTEATSLPLNSHLHHLLLTEFGITDIQACKAALSDPDMLTYHQVLLDPDIEEWKKSSHKGITQLESKETWVEVPTSEAISKILPGTWVFHHKRAITAVITKFKARYLLEVTYKKIHQRPAPVVSWSTIKLILVFTLTQTWHLIYVDFNNAFMQADLNDPAWIHLPRGYRSKTTTSTCLQLKKSLYGLSIIPKLWYQYRLIEHNFQQSAHDECLFFKSNMMIFLYMDDCGIASPDMSEIDAFIDRLKAKGFELTKECDFSAYLGIKFQRNLKNNTITMTQPGLVKKVIQATGMELCSTNKTPTSQTAPEGSPVKETWKYSSVVGMLLYLSMNTRPDIAFAVSQVA